MEIPMSDGASGFRRLGRLTIRTCVRGLVIAVLSVIPGIPLFIASVVSLPLLAVGIGVVPVPRPDRQQEQVLAQGGERATGLRRVHDADLNPPARHQLIHGPGRCRDHGLLALTTAIP
jgi:hypothetical protein